MFNTFFCFSLETTVYLIFEVHFSLPLLWPNSSFFLRVDGKERTLTFLSLLDKEIHADTIST